MPASAKTKSKPSTIDEYLAALPPDQRAALQRVRKIIRATVPDAVECISYQLPAFRLNGKGLLWFGAAAKHCALYGVGESLSRELDAYDTSGRGTLRFKPEQPLPAGLIRKLVKTRSGQLKK